MRCRAFVLADSQQPQVGSDWAQNEERHAQEQAVVASEDRQAVASEGRRPEAVVDWGTEGVAPLFNFSEKNLLH